MRSHMPLACLNSVSLGFWFFFFIFSLSSSSLPHPTLTPPFPSSTTLSLFLFLFITPFLPPFLPPCSYLPPRNATKTEHSTTTTNNLKKKASVHYPFSLSPFVLLTQFTSLSTTPSSHTLSRSF